MFKLMRFEENENCTLGILLDNIMGFVCYTLELPWRGNLKNMSRIPDGTYKAKLGDYKGTYESFLLETPEMGRDGIWFHIGNSSKDTTGCILVGRSISDDRKSIVNSTGAFDDFMRATNGATEFELKIQMIEDKKVTGDIRKKKYKFMPPKEITGGTKPSKYKISIIDKIVLFFSKIKPYLKSTLTLARDYVPGWAKLLIDLANKKLKEGTLKDPKNTISNWVGIVILIGGAVQTYIGTLNGDPINWLSLGMAVAVAVIAYFTGKTKDLKAKS